MLGGGEPLICVIISVRLSFNAAPYFQLKKTFSYLFFYCVFLNNARKSCAPFMEIFFPHDKFLQEKFPQHIPLFSPSSPQPKNPPENVCTLPNNHYYMQTLVKIVTYSPTVPWEGLQVTILTSVCI